MKVYPGTLNGFIRPPSSKSVTHRSLILAACGEVGSTIKNRLVSGDTDATKKALEGINAKFIEKEGPFQPLITEKPISKIETDELKINCFNSGTTLRLLSGISGLLPRETTLYGDSSLN
ncbi:MAG: 3-phosphoshikimate 1-carboxyvinyltransferase, partial [Candidatus Heimdallarchaeota archaeon LC_2]